MVRESLDSGDGTGWGDWLDIAPSSSSMAKELCRLGLTRGCIVATGRRDWRIEEANSDDRLGEIKHSSQGQMVFSRTTDLHSTTSDDVPYQFFRSCVNEHS
jgi:hypothetical protein